MLVGTEVWPPRSRELGMRTTLVERALQKQKAAHLVPILGWSVTANSRLGRNGVQSQIILNSV